MAVVCRLFDVFGFSRGAALARHFINALKDGIPGINSPGEPDAPESVFPNLFVPAEDGTTYRKDTKRTHSVRFVGLFDTVGSFYLPGNSDEGNFQLDLSPDCATTVYQITAAHEYRANFPLTTLKSKDESLPVNFFEEAYPGCHTDIGGGYPSKTKYLETGLPERYKKPRDSTYKVRCVYSTEIKKPNADNRDYVMSMLSSLISDCEREGVRYQIYKRDIPATMSALFFFNKLIPVGNALSALTLERMKQQAEKAGVEWEQDDIVNMLRGFMPEDWPTAAPELVDVNKHLLEKEMGQVVESDWSGVIEDCNNPWVNTPHQDAMANNKPSISGAIINRPNREDGQLKREVFHNEA